VAAGRGFGRRAGKRAAWARRGHAVVGFDDALDSHHLQIVEIRNRDEGHFVRGPGDVSCLRDGFQLQDQVIAHMVEAVARVCAGKSSATRFEGQPMGPKPLV